jgi:hypothetical protein
VFQSLSVPLREALRAAVAETMGSGSMPDADLETLRVSLSKTLQTAAPAEGDTVRDIRYRAMIAAHLDEIFSELRLARRS